MLNSLLKIAGVYSLYENRLLDQVKSNPMPEHVGIILDGNRRWAVEHVLPKWEGYKFGAKVGEEFLGWCLELGIKIITIYVFSTENFRRPYEEVSEILKIIEEQTRRLEGDWRLYERQVRVKAIGRLDLLPESLRGLLKKIELETKDYDKNYLNIAIAYGGRAEIIDAVRKIAEDINDKKIVPKQIDEDMFRDYLYTAHLPNPYPDLVIRTSGEERLSGFLIWQSAYSELCLTDVYWPDFRKIDFLRAIRTYQKRSRRFGS